VVVEGLREGLHFTGILAASGRYCGGLRLKVFPAD
jgi:hypothetical protein